MKTTHSPMAAPTAAAGNIAANSHALTSVTPSIPPSRSSSGSVTTSHYTSRRPPKGSQPAARSFAAELELARFDASPVERIDNVSQPIDGLRVRSDEDVEVTTSADPKMSRVPLLLRNSPALGTGSYGGLPVHASSDEDYVGSYDSTSNTKTGKQTANSKKDAASHPKATEDNGLGIGTAHVHTLNRSKSFQGMTARRKRAALEEANEGSNDQANGSDTDGPDIRVAGTATPSRTPRPDAGDVSLQMTDETGDYDASIEADDDSASDSSHSRKANTANGPADNSPYAQVRASVAATDDPALSINTPRMWTLSILFAVFGSSTNLFFSLRYPSVSITPVIALLIVHPLGLLWDRTFKRHGDPEGIYENGKLVTYEHPGSGRMGSSVTSLRSNLNYPHNGWRTNLRLWLAQGHWNEKEHSCVFISSNVSFGFAFATDVSNYQLLD